jgi:hypothetical protein
VLRSASALSGFRHFARKPPPSRSPGAPTPARARPLLCSRTEPTARNLPRKQSERFDLTFYGWKADLHAHKPLMTTVLRRAEFDSAERSICRGDSMLEYASHRNLWNVPHGRIEQGLRKLSRGHMANRDRWAFFRGKHDGYRPLSPCTDCFSISIVNSISISSRTPARHCRSAHSRPRAGTGALATASQVASVYRSASGRPRAIRH